MKIFKKPLRKEVEKNYNEFTEIKEKVDFLCEKLGYVKEKGSGLSSFASLYECFYSKKRLTKWDALINYLQVDYTEVEKSKTEKFVKSKKLNN